MIELKDRNHPVYQEIENFNDYELTECIAWEMAIRNKDVKTLLEKLAHIKNTIWEKYAYNRKHDKILYKHNTPDKDIYESLSILNFTKYSGTWYQKERDELAQLEKDATFGEALGKYSKSDIITLKDSLNSFEKGYRKVIENEMAYYATKEFLYSHDELPELVELANDFFYCYALLKDNYYIQYDDYLNSDYQEKNIIGNTKSSSWKFTNGRFQPYKITTKQGQNIDSTIFPEKSRPSLTIPEEFSSTISLNINLNLPLKETIEYIKELKEVYTLDTRLIKTNISKKTLLEIPNTKISYSTKRGTAKTTTLSKVFKSKKAIANMFYIYDQKKAGTKFSEIQKNISYYQDSMANVPRTIEPYFEIAKYYIESLHYKELITGHTPIT